MAQGILEKKVRDQNAGIFVDSAGTSDYHIGEQPDRRAIQKSSEYQIDISLYQGRQFTVVDFDDFDHIYVMDNYNYRDVLSLARSDEDRNKVEMILNKIYPGQDMSVPDPYYGGEEGFENVYKLLDRACDRIIEDIVYEG